MSALLLAPTLLVAGAVPLETPPGDAARPALTLDVAISEQRFVDLDGDGRSELVTISERGEVVRWTFDGDRGRLVQAGAPLQLDDPDHSALALVDVAPNPGLELCVLNRRGVVAHPAAPDGGWAAEPLVLTVAGRLGIRLGRPMFVPFTVDVNADGQLDLVVPSTDTCQLFLRADAPGEDSRFELSQVLPLPLAHTRQTSGRELSDELRNSIRIAGLDIEDLNGDGRPDLRVRADRVRRYFLQDAEGRFAGDPIEVDLGTFRDTTPRAEAAPGETLVLSDEPQMSTGDLNGDGIPDYVVAHRRKVWSFLSSSSGPQFDESSIRLVAQDVSGLLLVDLNDDGRDDLCVFKLDVPSSAELILGVVRSIDVPLKVLGYPSAADGTFATRAEWKSELVVRIPSLLRLLREAEDIVERFREVVRKFRWSATGDFDGDGSEDLALLAEDESEVELWLRPDEDDRDGERWLRELLFEDPDKTFDIERVLKLVAEVFEGRTSERTGEREADARATLDLSEHTYLIDAAAPDLDGDGRAELVLVETDVDGRRHLTVTVVPLRAR